MERINTADGLFSDGTAAAGYLDGTVVIAKWLNDMQEEACNIPLAAGLALDGSKRDQILIGLRRLFGGNVTTISASGATALTLDNAGLVLVDATAGNISLNLPAANALAAVRYEFRRLDATANSVTVNRVGADTIDLGATSFNLPEAGDFRHIESDGVNKWFTVSAKADLLAGSPAQFDWSSKLATTKYVGDNGVRFSPATRYYAGAPQLVLGAADVGCTICFNGGVAQSVKLPTTGNLPAGATICIFRAGASLLGVSSDDATAKIDVGSGALISSLNLQGGEDVTLTWSGVAWICSGAYPFRAIQMSASIAANGYQKLPSGLIVQWGQLVTSGSADVAVTFPIAFPSTCLAIAFANVSMSSLGNVGATGAPSQTGFSCAGYVPAGRATIGSRWIAIGN
ncbi:gp53-like domain-containing protein [Cupriavidus taiwanensis]|uniref:gp53-like domain-containing protein n=1 Tax=Cupriavidus taiwanensis TaxID=164546 RepID=UPI0004707E26|nr:hypothetical protein [Cupriavidus taiwanensis]SOZ12094.1 protein of unknown function [Cupriavidus taiwanensis]